VCYIVKTAGKRVWQCSKLRLQGALLSWSDHSRFALKPLSQHSKCPAGGSGAADDNLQGSANSLRRARRACKLCELARSACCLAAPGLKRRGAEWARQYATKQGTFPERLGRSATRSCYALMSTITISSNVPSH